MTAAGVRSQPTRPGRQPRLPWALLGLTSGLVVIMVILSLGREPLYDTVIYGLLPVALATIGALIASRQPANPIGWILAGQGVWGALTEALEGASYHDVPVAQFGAWLIGWSWVVDLSLYALVLLLFPNGRLLSRSWRMGVGVLIAGLVLAVPGQAFSGDNPENPFVVDSPLVGAAFGIGIVLLLGSLLGAVVSLLVRFRRARGVERQQVKLLLFAGSIILPAAAVTIPFYYESVVLQVAIGFALLLLPVAIGLAILRYRLYDIDVVINKTLVYGALAAFITAIYVAIVVGLGALLGGGDQEPSLGLSIVATALIALAFQPFKEKVQKVANRMVYGNRSTPYEVLADFSARMVGSHAQDELLKQMASTLAEGTGAGSAHVWLKVRDQLRLAAAFHRDGVINEDPGHHTPIRVTGTGFEIEGADLVMPVLHKGELLGALAITKRPGEQVTPVEDKLMNDLAAQAGVVLRNVRLTEELLQRLDELRASRQRLVAAQDSARRKLERDLHDGAQQQLVALKVKLSLAQRMTGQEKVKSFLTQLQAEADDTLQTLRDLARGIYPPLLADRGLPAALVAQANKSALPVQVQADGVGRYSQEVEAAVYFCCLEAMQNVAKYAGPCEVVVNLTADGETLTFEVADTGVGFDPSSSPRGHGLQNMTDRVDALGGALSVSSQPGGGTVVRGRLPARVLAPAV